MLNLQVLQTTDAFSHSPLLIESARSLHCPKVSKLTVQLARTKSLQLQDSVRLCLPPWPSRGRRDLFACSTGFLWHSSNHVCPLLICMPSVNPSLDAFVYITTLPPSPPPQSDSTPNLVTARVLLPPDGCQTRNPCSTPVRTISWRLHFFLKSSLFLVF